MENTQLAKIAYPLEETAYLCGVSKAKLRKDVAAGKLKAKKLGSKVLVLRADLIDYLENTLTDWVPASER